MGEKERYQQMILNMVSPLKAHYSKTGAGLYLGAAAAGYGSRIAAMEGFSRVLWGMVSYWARGGRDESLLPLYVRGLGTGQTRPQRSTGEIFTTKTSGWWRWQPSATGF